LNPSERLRWRDAHRCVARQRYSAGLI